MPDILSKQNGSILEITLNRPDRGNGADDAMAIELTRAINEAPDETKCIVLRGAGDDFCTGRVGGPPPSGPGPVVSDPARPYVSFYKNRNNPNPLFRVADLSNPILQP